MMTDSLHHTTPAYTVPQKKTQQQQQQKEKKAR